MQTAELAITETYEDVENLIYKLCHDYHTKTGMEFDELVGEAHIIFMKVYHSFAPNKGSSFSNLIYVSIYRRFNDILANKKHKWESTVQSLDNVNRYGEAFADSVPAKESRDNETLYNELIESGKLSPEAQFVLDMYQKAPRCVSRLAEAKGNSGRNWKTSIRSHLKELGWSVTEIVKAFDEIADALNS